MLNGIQSAGPELDKIRAAMLNDDTKKMYLFYNNPLMEIEW